MHATKSDIHRARRLSAESRKEFQEAHQRGMQCLRAGDVRGLIRSIDEELSALSKQQRALAEIMPKRLPVRRDDQW